MPDVEFVKAKVSTAKLKFSRVLDTSVRLKIVAGLMSQSCNVKKIWECLGLPQAQFPSTWPCSRNKGIIAAAAMALKSITRWCLHRRGGSHHPARRTGLR